MVAAQTIYLIIILFVLFLFVVTFFSFYLSKTKKLNVLSIDFKDREAQLKRKLYESAVLEELNERYGYSLDIEKIVDTVVGSLENLIEHSASSYILLDGKKLVFKTHLAESVSEGYKEEIKRRMYQSIKELTNSALENRKWDESVSGAFISNVGKSEVESFFNVPLVIDDEVVGVFNVSSTKEDMFQTPEATLLYKIIGRATGAVTKLQRVLRQEEGKLKSMVSSMTEGVLMVDEDFRILVINPAFLELLSVKARGKAVTIFDVVSTFDNQISFEQTLAEVFEKGERKIISRVGVNEKQLQISFLPVQVSEGRRAVEILIHDQTRERELEKLREDFTAMMIHELRAPLTVMKGTSDLLVKEFKNLPKKKVESLLAQIEESSSGLLDIVNDLLDVAKTESGRFELSKEEGDIGLLLREEVQVFKSLAVEKGLGFDLKDGKNLPKFKFDHSKVVQVINNLFSNAIKFTDKGGVFVTLEKDGSFAKITVTDTGRGIPDDEKGKLFNKFVQLRETAVTTGRGTGLGLVVAKGIVEAHGGRIWMENNSPQGSKFIFTLPLEKDGS